MSYAIVSPPIIPTPWGSGADPLLITNPVPTGSQVAVTAGAASLETGFVAANFADPDAGGIHVSGQDFNGIFYMLSANVQNWQAGNNPKFNSAFATAVGGYPVGAILQSDDAQFEYINVLAGNTNNFNTSPANIGVNWMVYKSSAPTVASILIQLPAVPTTYQYSVINGCFQYHTVANAVAGWSINVKWSDAKTLSSMMPDNASRIELTHGVKMGSTAYQLTGLTIDGVSQTIAWLNGSAPTAPALSLCDYKFVLSKITGGWLVQGEMKRY